VNKFTTWMKVHDKKQISVAEKLGISSATLHQIMHKGRIPNITLAYKIEQYTRGAISLYDWIDDPELQPKRKAVQPTPIGCT
jgi:transcriptional regulator with XRE-family HTH domain